MLVVLYIIGTALAPRRRAAYGVMALTLAVCVRVSRVGLKALVRGLKPVLFIHYFYRRFEPVFYTGRAVSF